MTIIVTVSTDGRFFLRKINKNVPNLIHNTITFTSFSKFLFKFSNQILIIKQYSSSTTFTDTSHANKQSNNYYVLLFNLIILLLKFSGPIIHDQHLPSSHPHNIRCKPVIVNTIDTLVGRFGDRKILSSSPAPSLLSLPPSLFLCPIPRKNQFITDKNSNNTRTYHHHHSLLVAHRGSMPTP